uniref:Uncharacterized protein n=1 Tax=uncultured Nocardioidaceae bacterium TaxID=253824 RepID=A0A6J4KSM7_9ACTN|nr:MAG: hypothetical protein AVDCRST_MAG46-386 [uncultured Nocardioidaceae bacterium]
MITAGRLPAPVAVENPGGGRWTGRHHGSLSAVAASTSVSEWTWTRGPTAPSRDGLTWGGRDGG